MASHQQEDVVHITDIIVNQENPQLTHHQTQDNEETKQMLKSNNNHNSYHHYQIGAPTLVYEGNRTEDRVFNGPSSALTSVLDKEKDLYEYWKKHNRVKARWHFDDLGVEQQVESILVHTDDTTADNGDDDVIMRKRKQTSSRDLNCDSDGGDDDAEEESGYNDDDDDEGDEDNSNNDNEHEVSDHSNYRVMDDRQQRNRLAMLLEANSHPTKHRTVLHNHAVYEYPYVPVNRIGRPLSGKDDGTFEPRISKTYHSRTEEFCINYHRHSDASYLAPFDLLGMTEVLFDETGTMFRKRVHRGHPERLPRGNAMLIIPCPCGPCSNKPNRDRSWVLFHPKGPCLERFCISNLIPPLGAKNNGHIVSTSVSPQRKTFYWDAIELLPNEIDLDDTILEIGQCGEWNVQNPKCVFIARTGTHVSVLNVQCNQPVFDGRGAGGGEAPPAATPSLDPRVCWGCYVVTEKERIDLRSLSPRIPSYRPVSISCHPRYGYSFVPARFAFVAHSTASNDTGPRNIVYSCTVGDGNIVMTKQSQRNLRHISTIDFTSSNPVCLWSAATSFIRPALAPGVTATLAKMEKGPIGLGTSLFMIDLRKSEATFQWSPSAEEMVTEGVHSISGILTDWERENTVWVTSTSAGKTWEIDGRMPCRSINSWSLTSSCETSGMLTVPSKGFFGDGSLLTKTLSGNTDDDSRIDTTATAFGLPIVKVDTDPGSSGIHLFQRPLNRPRFQTDSLECVASPGIGFNNNTSIASSSYFALPEVVEDVNICGISSIRFPISKYVTCKDEGIWTELLEGNDQVSVLCTLTMTNYGDIYSHSLLECKDNTIDDIRRHDGLPVGSSAIPVLDNIDGRLLYLKEGHRKPTGGMNIRLFLSNSYPKSRNAKLSSERPARDKTRVVLNATKKLKVTKKTALVDTKNQTDKSAVTIYSRSESDMMGCGGNLLALPASILDDVRTRMRFSGDEGERSDFMQMHETEDQQSRSRRCDLSNSSIHDILNKWDGRPSSPSSSSDSDEPDSEY